MTVSANSGIRSVYGLAADYDLEAYSTRLCGLYRMFVRSISLESHPQPVELQNLAKTSSK